MTYTVRIEVIPRRILKVERYVAVINFVEKFEKKKEIEEYIYILGIYIIGFRFDISMGFFFLRKAIVYRKFSIESFSREV